MAAPRVLLIEDDFLLRATMAAALRNDGFEVIEAEDGDAASVLIGGPDGFDLLLTDVHMPGRVDGIGAAALARARYPGIPVIIVSGISGANGRSTGFKPTAVFMPKPYVAEEIILAVRGMLKDAA
jgi:DNA-binding response OmpR family regulator